MVAGIDSVARFGVVIEMGQRRQRHFDARRVA